MSTKDELLTLTLGIANIRYRELRRLVEETLSEPVWMTELHDALLHLDVAINTMEEDHGKTNR